MLLKLWFCLGMTENHTASCYNQKNIIFFKQLTPWNSKFSLNWKYFTYVAMVRWHTQPFIGLTFETCSIEMLNAWSNSVVFPGNVTHKQLNIFPSKHCSPFWTDCLWILVTRDLWNPFCVEWSFKTFLRNDAPINGIPLPWWRGNWAVHLHRRRSGMVHGAFEFVMSWSIARCFGFVKLSSFTASLPKTTPLSGICMENIFLWQTGWTCGLPSFFTSTILADVWEQFWGCAVETNKFNR